VPLTAALNALRCAGAPATAIARMDVDKCVFGAKKRGVSRAAR
jgi:hypothetical protein